MPTGREIQAAEQSPNEVAAEEIPEWKPIPASDVFETSGIHIAGDGSVRVQKDRANPDPHALQLAIGLHQDGRLDQAERMYKAIIKAQPGNFNALYLLGVAKAQQGKPEPAAQFFDKAARLKPDFVDAHYNHGVMLNAIAQHGAAINAYDNALRLNPHHTAALRNRATSLFELRRFHDALAGYDRLLALEPNAADVHDHRGVVLRELERFEEAVESHDRALALDPNNAESARNRGIALRALKRFDEALESYDLAITIKPDYAEAYFSRAVALTAMKRFADAIRCYDRSIQLQPDYAEAYNNRGVVLHDLKRFDEALQCHDRAIQIKPDYAEAYCNRALVLMALKRFTEALQSCDAAIRRKPDYAEAHINRGIALTELKRLDEALRNYDRAIEIKPALADAYYNRGVTLNILKRFDEAVKSYDRVVEIDPKYDFIYGTRLHAKMRICDWRDLENDIAVIRDKVLHGEKASHPFPLTAVATAASVQRKAAETWAVNKLPSAHFPPEFAARRRREKIRIGYFSTDFHGHATAFLMAGLFEAHDRSKFELIAFSLGPDREDDTRKRLMSTFDHFVDVRLKSDAEVAVLARALEIDIAVDLNGFAQNARTAIFALRAAPIQVSYLGYPGTMGAEYIDYLVADRTLIPPLQQSHYTEKLVYLPDTYQANDRTRRIADRLFTRSEAGLPQDGFVFTCFNNNYKITPEVFGSWMRILQQVDDSVLWLFEDNRSAAAHLRSEAARRNVSPDRLVFAHYMPLPEHLARHRLADLFLDTLPYNAHTTASDALWAGLPVLTRVGDTFPGRVAASLLNAIGLPELVTATPQEYEDLAVALARSPDKLPALKRKLADNRLTTPLFDTLLFKTHIEAAYAAMYERYHAGLPPDHISVQR